jgi:hypothetical protein
MIIQYVILAQKVFDIFEKQSSTKWRMDIGRDGYWKPHVNNSFALSVPKISKAVAAPPPQKKDTE